MKHSNLLACRLVIPLLVVYNAQKSDSHFKNVDKSVGRFLEGIFLDIFFYHNRNDPVLGDTNL